MVVGYIVDAYNPASNAYHTLILTLLLKDNSSQNAHSNFIYGFIYGVVATIGVKSEIFNQNGILFIFKTTILVFNYSNFYFYNCQTWSSKNFIS